MSDDGVTLNGEAELRAHFADATKEEVIEEMLRLVDTSAAVWKRNETLRKLVADYEFVLKLIADMRPSKDDLKDAIYEAFTVLKEKKGTQDV